MIGLFLKELSLYLPLQSHNVINEVLSRENLSTPDHQSTPPVLVNAVFFKILKGAYLVMSEATNDRENQSRFLITDIFLILPSCDTTGTLLFFIFLITEKVESLSVKSILQGVLGYLLYPRLHP